MGCGKPHLFSLFFQGNRNLTAILWSRRNNLMIIRNNTKNGSPLSSVQKDSSQHPTYIPARRDLKDRLFKFIFGDPQHKEWTLALYNSIEHTSYDDPDDLEIVTLDNAVYMHMKNDVGVLVSSWNLAF